MRDSVIWTGCICLMMIGAVFGAASPATNFWNVENIHDGLEILASIATVIAVVFAVLSFDSWRGEIKGSADHALAQRVAVAVMQYKDTSAQAWSYAESIIANKEYSTWGVFPGDEAEISALYAELLRRFERKKAELLALMLEVKALWRVESLNGSGLDELLTFTERCFDCMRIYVRANDRSSTSTQIEKYKADVKLIADQFLADGFEVNNVGRSKIFELSKEFDDVVLKKMFR